MQADSGNPAFTSRNGAYIDQVVLLSDQPGSLAVLVGITASQTVVAGQMGYMVGHFNDIDDPSLVITPFDLPTLKSQSTTPNEWVVLSGYLPISPRAGSLRVFLDVVEDLNAPQDAPLTWFDDIGLFIVDTEQEAIDIIDDYTVDHTW